MYKEEKMVGFTSRKSDATARAVAKAMSDKTPWHITPEMVTPIKPMRPYMAVYAAQTGNVTILCWAHINGHFTVKYTKW